MSSGSFKDRNSRTELLLRQRAGRGADIGVALESLQGQLVLIDQVFERVLGGVVVAEGVVALGSVKFLVSLRMAVLLTPFP
jgi:hypothetical protein